MPTIVVPFHGPGGKQRLAPLAHASRAQLAAAMLADVLAAAAPLGRSLVVAPADARDVVAAAGADDLVADPGTGQGDAVAAALAAVVAGPVLIVNADLPCATTADLQRLLDAVPPAGAALVEARDGTTNALALSSPSLFRPLYGPGSAARFRALEGTDVRSVEIANLIDDVDTLDDLDRVAQRLGLNTLRAQQRLMPAGAAA
jgi:2-phospho-L-lactate guanylyltransferase